MKKTMKKTTKKSASKSAQKKAVKNLAVKPAKGRTVRGGGIYIGTKEPPEPPPTPDRSRWIEI